MFAKEIRDSNNNARPVISSYIMPQNSESITIPRKEYDLLVKQSALPAYMNENQREKLRSYRDNMFEKDEKIKDLETRLKKSDENNVKFQTDIEHLNDKIKELTKNCIKEQSKYKDTKDKLERITYDLNDSNKSNRELNSENIELRNKIEELNNELIQLDNKHVSINTNMLEKISKLIEEKKILKAEIKKLQKTESNVQAMSDSSITLDRFMDQLPINTQQMSNNSPSSAFIQPKNVTTHVQEPIIPSQNQKAYQYPNQESPLSECRLRTPVLVSPLPEMSTVEKADIRKEFTDNWISSNILTTEMEAPIPCKRPLESLVTNQPPPKRPTNNVIQNEVPKTYFTTPSNMSFPTSNPTPHNNHSFRQYIRAARRFSNQQKSRPPPPLIDLTDEADKDVQPERIKRSKIVVKEKKVENMLLSIIDGKPTITYKDESSRPTSEIKEPIQTSTEKSSFLESIIDEKPIQTYKDENSPSTSEIKEPIQRSTKKSSFLESIIDEKPIQTYKDENSPSTSKIKEPIQTSTKKSDLVTESASLNIESEQINPVILEEEERLDMEILGSTASDDESVEFSPQEVERLLSQKL